jgi:nucleoside-diphosphate-sugar epimerase
MRSIVFGATGHIGFALSLELQKQGHDVLALSRGNYPPKNLERHAISWQAADLFDTSTFLSLIRSNDSIYICAVPYPLSFNLSEQDSSKYLKMCQELVLVAKQSKAKQIILVSSIFNMNLHPTTASTEADFGAGNLNSSHAYFHVKYLVEKTIEEMCIQKNLRLKIINPVGCIGPYDPKPSQLSPLLYLSKLPFKIQSKEHLYLIDVRDLAKLMIKAGNYNAPLIRFLAIGNKLSMESFHQDILDAHAIKRSLRVPLSMKFLSKLLTNLEYIVSKKLEIKLPLPSLLFELVARCGIYDDQLTQKALEISPFIPCKESIVDALRDRKVV